MKNIDEKISSLDNMIHIRDSLENLIGTMAVIYEGLSETDMTEESPHCILILQKAAETILSLVQDEVERIKQKDI